MRATSACFRPPSDVPAARRGFTLLELLVVLVLVGIVSALVAPTGLRQLDAVRERGVDSDLMALLESLPVKAQRAGELQVHDEASLVARLPGLPAGWRVVPDRPLRYSASGVAEGGTVRLLVPGQPARIWRIAAGTGVVDAPPR